MKSYKVKDVMVLIIGAMFILFLASYRLDLALSISSLIAVLLAWKAIKLKHILLQLQRDMIKMKNHLQGTVEQIHGSCSQLDESSSEQSSAMTQTSASCHEVKTLTENNHDSFSSIKDLVGVINKNISQSSKLADDLEGCFQSGVDTNKNVINTLDQTKALLNQLQLQFSKVVEKTGVINDIVFQTKLLSFNASVEAARAGEHGRGFSVVAEEIGNLASMSGESANSIQTTLEETQAEVSKIVGSMEESTLSLEKSIKEQMSSSQESLELFKESFFSVTGGTAKIDREIEEVSLALGEQVRSMMEITDATSSVGESVQRNTLVVGQTTNLASELSKELDKFQESVDAIELVTKTKSVVLIDQIPWDNKYAINIPRIDNEHIEILDNINFLIDAMNLNNTAKMKKAFDALKQVTVDHFSYEEDFMQSFEYSSYSSHKKVHENLLNTLDRFGSDLNRGDLDRSRLASFLKNWLFTHIMGVDTKYAADYANVKLAG